MRSLSQGLSRKSLFAALYLGRKPKLVLSEVPMHYAAAFQGVNPSPPLPQREPTRRTTGSKRIYTGRSYSYKSKSQILQPFKYLELSSVHLYSTPIKTYGWKAIYQTINIKKGTEALCFLQQCGNYPGRDE